MGIGGGRGLTGENDVVPIAHQGGEFGLLPIGYTYAGMTNGIGYFSNAVIDVYIIEIACLSGDDLVYYVHIGGIDLAILIRVGIGIQFLVPCAFFDDRLQLVDIMGVM